MPGVLSGGPLRQSHLEKNPAVGLNKHAGSGDLVKEPGGLPGWAKVVVNLLDTPPKD
jgi:hypothetical protein